MGSQINSSYKLSLDSTQDCRETAVVKGVISKDRKGGVLDSVRFCFAGLSLWLKILSF